MKAIDNEELREKLSKYTLVKGNGCWEWQGGSWLGYGQVWDGRLKKNWRAHKLSYILNKGEVPDGLVLDHLCKNTICINPEHLEAVTQKENVMRGIGPTAQNAKKTHCKRGHELSGYNLVELQGTRKCRKCRNMEHENRLRHKNFNGNREKAIQRDGEKCVECGTTRREHQVRYKRDITVFHIVKGNHDLDNLLTVCSKHHSMKIQARLRAQRAALRHKYSKGEEPPHYPKGKIDDFGELS